jgi:general secretion pathway protein B
MMPRTQRIGREPSGSSPAGLKVNGLAVQDDPSASVAVIDGMLVRRGMTVQGMRVEEILQDRVRFSRNGETYEVQISR